MIIIPMLTATTMFSDWIGLYRMSCCHEFYGFILTFFFGGGEVVHGLDPGSLDLVML